MFTARWRPQPTSGRQAPPGLVIDPVEWEMAVSMRAPVLIEGPKSALEQTIYRLAVDLPTPMMTWPDTDSALDATVLVEEVASFGESRQRALLEWIASSQHRPKVISTSSTPLYDAVLRERFLPELFYHLNVIHLRVRH